MAKAFECEVCGALFPGDSVYIGKEISHQEDVVIGIRAAMYGRTEDMYGHLEIYAPDVCVHCQLQAMKDLIREYEKED